MPNVAGRSHTNFIGLTLKKYCTVHCSRVINSSEYIFCIYKKKLLEVPAGT